VLLLGGGTDAGGFRQLAWIALPLGLGALALLLFAVPGIPRTVTVPRRLGFTIPKPARGYLALVFLFALANSSDAFLVLKAREAGFTFGETLALFLVFNGLAAALAIPAGRLSDRFGRVRFLAAGWIVYAAAYTVMGLAASSWTFAAALLGYGAFYGLTEGVEKALLADLLPAGDRGAGFGAFQSVHGLGALIASPLMGFLMTRFGSRPAFAFAGATALTAAVLLVAWQFRRRPMVG
jgi:MFS family permease